MYPFDAPFWQKMFFICLVTGIGFLISELIDAIPKAKKDFKAWKKNYFENEYPKVKAETKRMVKKMRQKIFKKSMCVIIIGMFVISGLFMLVNIPSVSATIDTHIWDGGEADTSAGTSGNWVGNIHPEVGDSVIINTGSKNVVWNLTFTIGSFTMNGTYSGIITQTTNLSCGDWTLISGTWTGNVNYNIISSGNIIYTSGTFTDFVTNIIMTGVGKSISFYAVKYINMFKLNPNAKVTVTNAIFVDGIYIGIGAEWIINYGVTFDWDGTRTFENYGLISGTAYLSITLYDVNKTWIAGIISCPIFIFARSIATGDRMITLGADTILSGNSFVVYTTSSYKTIFAVSNYDFTAKNMILGKTIGNKRGEMTQGSGTITLESYTQQGSASIFTKGSGDLLIAKNIILSGGTFIPSGIIQCGGNWDSHTITFTQSSSKLYMTSRLFSAYSSNNLTFTIPNLSPNRQYDIIVDGNKFTGRKANSTGIIEFTYTTWSYHTFEIVVNFGGTIYSALFIILAISAIIGVGLILLSTRQEEFTLRGMLMIIIAFFVGAILLSLGITVLWT